MAPGKDGNKHEPTKDAFGKTYYNLGQSKSSGSQPQCYNPPPKNLERSTTKDSVQNYHSARNWTPNTYTSSGNYGNKSKK